MRRALRAIALLVVASVVVPGAASAAVLGSFLFLPLPVSLPEPREGVEGQISRIYDIHGNQIGVFRQFETTKPVQPTDIPEHLKQAVIAAEDRRFYSHEGIDVRGTLRALWADIRNVELVQGGSTITQQYVKNTYTGSERSLARKFREAVLARQIDRQFDKEEILFRYLQQVYLGEGAYGVGAASETYFHKPVNLITLSEAAMLAGLIPAPSRYEPRGNVELAEQKRLHVLRVMLEQGYIDQPTHDAAAAERLWLETQGPPPEGQPHTMVFGRQRAETAFPYFVDYVQRYLAARYGEDAVYTQGLEIYTTLDPRLQLLAEQSVRDTLAGTAPPLEMALVTVEPGSGFVKALVGGRDFYAPGGQVNLALGPDGGGTGRQTGSSFKPFVLAEAFEQGVTPNKTYSGANAICVAADYCPQNYGGASYGRVSLRTATTKSVNTVFVQLLRDVGLDSTVELVERLGIDVPDDSQAGLSAALGVYSTSPLAMASAYSTFANRGERVPPTPVVTVLDPQPDGTLKTIEDNREPKGERVLKEITADNLNSVLQGPLGPGGTAGGRGIGRPAAGKTGTTQDSGDAWFVGYTPNLSTAVWMGHRDSRAPMRGIKGVRAVTGGSFPARTWQAFMKAAHDDLPVVEFNRPAPITRVADAAKRQARAGFDVGTRRNLRTTDGGGTYVHDLPPTAPPPPPTTTTSSTSTTTTSTTLPGDDDGGGGIFDPGG